MNVLPQHKPLLVLPRSVVDVYTYTHLLCELHKIPSKHHPNIRVVDDLKGAMGLYQIPNNLYFWANPAYELTVYHEFLHFLGFYKFKNPVHYVQEIYFQVNPMFERFRKKKRERIHNYCGTCNGTMSFTNWSENNE